MTDWLLEMSILTVRLFQTWLGLVMEKLWCKEGTAGEGDSGGSASLSLMGWLWRAGQGVAGWRRQGEGLAGRAGGGQWGSSRLSPRDPVMTNMVGGDESEPRLAEDIGVRVGLLIRKDMREIPRVQCAPGGQGCRATQRVFRRWRWTALEAPRVALPEPLSPSHLPPSSQCPVGPWNTLEAAERPRALQLVPPSCTRLCLLCVPRFFTCFCSAYRVGLGGSLILAPNPCSELRSHFLPAPGQNIPWTS